MRRTLSRFIGRLTVGRKLALIYFLDLTAVIFVSGILIHEKFIAINFASKEIIGNQYISFVRDTLLSFGSFERDVAIDHVAYENDRNKLVVAVAKAEAAYGTEMDSAELSHDFGTAIG